MPKSPSNPQNLAQILEQRRWTPIDAASVVTAWRRSGLSRRGFCEQHGIDSQRLGRWCKQVPDTPEAPVFAEVIVIGEPASSPSGSAISVELGSARVIVDHHFDDEHLARVLRIVGSVC